MDSTQMIVWDAYGLNSSDSVLIEVVHSDYQTSLGKSVSISKSMAVDTIAIVSLNDTTWNSGDEIVLWHVGTHYTSGDLYKLLVTNMSTNNSYESDDFYIKDKPATITVTSPVADDTVTTGSDLSITWEDSGAVGDFVSISLVTASGYSTNYTITPRKVIDTISSNQKNYTWTTGTLDTCSNCNIKVQGVSRPDVYDLSGQLTLKAPPDFQNLLFPTQGFEWIRGRANTIMWQSISVSLVNIYLEDANTRNIVLDIAKDMVNEDEYDYILPLDAPLGDNYILHISDAESGKKISSQPFSIVDPKHISIIYPTADANWYADKTYSIQWDHTGEIDSVKILLNRNQTIVDTLTDMYPNTGSFSFTVPTDLQTGAGYSIVVSSFLSDSISATSSEFEIKSAVSVSLVKPDSNAQWLIDSTYQVSWNSSGEIPTVSLFLLKESNPIDTIATNITNNGQYLWTPDSSLAADSSYQIKILADVDSSTTATSDVFTITTLKALNTPPEFNAPSSAILVAGVESDPIFIGIEDMQTSSDKLTLKARSADQTIIADSNITLIHLVDTAKITIMPNDGKNGTTSIILTALDEFDSTETAIIISVRTQDAPSITSIDNKELVSGQVSSAIEFTITDTETDPKELDVWVASSDTTVLPSDSILLTGSDSLRAIEIHTIKDKAGLSTVSVSVSDSFDTTTIQFNVTITNASTDPQSAPTISQIPSQVLIAGTVSDTFQFTVSDSESAASAISVTATSSDPDVISDSDITLSGTGETRTIQIETPANKSGTTVITITASDGQAETTSSFSVSIRQVSAPSISSISNTSVLSGEISDEISFVINDNETNPEELELWIRSSDVDLIPADSIIVKGSDSTRSLSFHTTPGKTGTSDITVFVSDQIDTTQISFTASVLKNTAPLISSLPDIIINNQTDSYTIPVHVIDSETVTSDLDFSFKTSRAAIIAISDISYDFAGDDTVLITISPTSDSTGTTDITLIISDGVFQEENIFSFTVDKNSAPQLGQIAHITRVEPRDTITISTTILDEHSPISELTFKALSTNPGIIPDSIISIEIREDAIEVKIPPPEVNVFGAALISLIASDDQLSDTVSFIANILPSNIEKISVEESSEPNIETHDLVWRPIGYSYQPQITDPVTILGLGDIDTKLWRLAKWENSIDDYIFLNSSNANQFQFATGNMFWLVARNDVTIVPPAGKGTSIDSSCMFTIPPEGWHDFVLPFMLERGVSFKTIHAVSHVNLEDYEIWEWTDSTRTLLMDPLTNTIPDLAICKMNHYYSIKNKSGNSITITIPPVEAPENLLKTRNHLASLMHEDNEWQYELKVIDNTLGTYDLLSLGNKVIENNPQSDKIRLYSAPPSLSPVQSCLKLNTYSKNRVSHIYAQQEYVGPASYALIAENRDVNPRTITIQRKTKISSSSQFNLVLWDPATKALALTDDADAYHITLQPGEERVLSISFNYIKEFQALQQTLNAAPLFNIQRNQNKIVFTSNHMAHTQFEIEVFDIYGRLLFKNSGNGRITWNNRGPAITSKMYIVNFTQLIDNRRTGHRKTMRLTHVK